MSNASRSGGERRAFVIEDNEQVRRLAVVFLSRLGFEVAHAEDSRSARERFEPGRYDLLFSDVILPDGNGYELAEALLREDPEVRVLLTSGYVGVIAERLSERARSWPLLSKPFRFKELERMVGELMAAGEA